MADKQTSFTVTDRRKFNLDGELRDPAVAEELHDAAGHTIVSPTPPRAVAVPVPEDTPLETPADDTLEIDPDPFDEVLDGDEPAEAIDEASDEELGPIPTSQESADQQAAYRTTSAQLDQMIREANPGAPLAPDIDFEQVVQSFYLSAVIAMGAAAEPGQKPRVDIIGARQSIDMLAVLVDKTKGNLNEREQKLLQTAVFNLRMMFLELTNNLAAQATKAPRPGILR